MVEFFSSAAEQRTDHMQTARSCTWLVEDSGLGVVGGVLYVQKAGEHGA